VKAADEDLIENGPLVPLGVARLLKGIRDGLSGARREAGHVRREREACGTRTARLRLCDHWRLLQYVCADM
jgi:hypothetical protein